MLLFFHLGILTISNITTIEFCENKKDKYIYNKGIYNNIIDIMGNNIIGWILPIYPYNKV